MRNGSRFPGILVPFFAVRRILKLGRALLDATHCAAYATGVAVPKALAVSAAECPNRRRAEYAATTARIIATPGQMPQHESLFPV